MENVTTSLDTSDQHIALPTAVAQVLIKDKLTDINCLFDQGSQKTLVSKDFVNKFNLKPTGTSTMKISGINSGGSVKTYNNYTLAIKTNDELIKLQATCLDNLPCIQMPGFQKVVKGLKSKVKNLAKYNMSHSGRFQVELLIGCDHYFKIVNSNKFDVFDTLRLIPTKVGSIACGPYEFDNFTSNLISNYSNNFVSNINPVEFACEHMTRS